MHDSSELVDYERTFVYYYLNNEFIDYSPSEASKCMSDRNKHDSHNTDKYSVYFIEAV